MKSLTRICSKQSELVATAQALLLIPEDKLPIAVSIRKMRPLRDEDKNRLLNAHIRDIARHLHGNMTVPERLFERIVNDIKAMKVNGAHIWPRYSEPEPDTFTGEILYRPKSRSDLNNDEIRGIVNWLELYMAEKGITSHAPEERWSE